MTGRDPADMPGFEPGSVLAGYRLEARVGEGGMAVVYRARDERLHRLVALKILAPGYTADAGFRQRFIRESEAAAAVDHPHIIPIYLAGDAGGVLFIAMRFVSGGDLRLVMEREGPLPPVRVGEIVSPVASALDAAHIAGLVHRDVKPGNLLVDTGPGRPDHMLLSDFGISKSAATAGTLTGTGQFIGTAGYSAPEQIAERPVDGRADQYALACVTYELLTGETLFQRQSIYAVLIAHVHEQAPLLTSRRPDLPSAADGVLARALAKSPEDRYPSCADFADALREAFGLPPYHAGRTVLRPAQDRPPGKPPEPSRTERPGTEAPEIPFDSEASTATVMRTALITQPLQPPAQTPETRAGTGLVPVPEKAAQIPPMTGVPVGAPSAAAPPEPAGAAEAPPEPEAAEADAAAEPEAVQANEAAAAPGAAEAPPEPEAAEADAAPEPEAVQANEAAAAPGVAEDAEAEEVAGVEPVAEPQLVAEAEAHPSAEAGLLSTSTTWTDLAADSALTQPTLRELAATDELPAVELDSAADSRAADGRESMAAPPSAAEPAPDVPDGAAPGGRPPEIAVLGPAPAGKPPTGAPRDWRRRLPVVAVSAVVVGAAVTIPFMLKSPASAAHPQHPVSPSATVPAPVPPPRATRIPLPASLSGRAILSASFNPSGSTLAVAGALGTCLIDVATQHCTITIAPADTVRFSPDGTILASGNNDSSAIQLWRAATGRQVLPALSDPDSDGVISDAFSPDGRTLAVGDLNGTTYLWNVAAKKPTPVPLPDPGSKGVDAVAFSPDGTMLAAGDTNGKTYLWNAATRRVIAKLTDPGSKNGVFTVAFSPDGKTLATGDGNGRSYLWNVTTKKLIRSLSDAGGQGVRAVAFSPNGGVLAAGDNNGITYLWRISDGKLITSLSSTSGPGVTSVTFSRDGKTLITGNEDSAVDSWPVGTVTGAN